MSINLPASFPIPSKVRTPESAPRNSYDKVREYEFTFQLDGIDPDEYGRPAEANAIRLEISHGHAGGKTYSARAKVVTIHGPMVSERFSFRLNDGELPDGAQVAPSQPAPRYSRKALDVYAAAVVANLDPATFGAGSKVAALFARIIAAQAAQVA